MKDFDKLKLETMHPYYCCVRQTDGKFWIDTSTIKPTREDSERIQKDLDNNIPLWAKDNNCVGIRQCKISLI